MGFARTLGIVVIGLGIVAGGGYLAYTQVLGGQGIQSPDAGVEDIGDWGNVSEDRIELVHTLWIQNPNPTSVHLGDDITLGAAVTLNDVRLGAVEKTGIDIQQGNNSVPVTTEVEQDRLGEFWAAFIAADETIHAAVTPTVRVQAGSDIAVSTPPVRVSALTDEQPISDAMNQTGDAYEGTYTKEVSTEDLPTDYVLPRTDVTPSGSVTAEYTFERVDFEWGEVTPERTEVKVHVRVRNTGDTVLPGVPDGVAADILLNDIQVFSARNQEAVAVRNVDRDVLLTPGETTAYTIVATAENQHIEEWLTTFARQDEHSDVRSELAFVFEIGDTTLRAPDDGVVAYECAFQTGIFVDNQSTATTCGTNGTVELGPVRYETGQESDQSDRSSETTPATSTATPTPTPTPESTRTSTATTAPSTPTAAVDASPTDGEAPLPVSFDASGSTDPDGDIVAYEWRFDDGRPPASGAQVEHTFGTPGTYDVDVTVIDSEGNRDTATVTITVERSF